MKIELKTIFGDLIIEGDFACIADAIKAAIKGGKSLRYADLSYANLSSADLSSANLRYADLSYANLSYANLRYANLSSANLSYANLRYANLSSADLRYANLSSADLSSANLRYADLSYANLSSANLRYADLSYANLSYANLRYANLSSADLSETKGSKLAIAQTRILPEGSLIGWKRCVGDVIVKVRIPEEAKRSHAFGRKCRAEFVDVLEVHGGEVGKSSYDHNVTYEKGKRVMPLNGFSDDYSDECAAGIHFFITRDEAEAYSL